MKNVRGRKNITLLEGFQSIPARPSGRSSVKIKNANKDVRMATEVARNKKSKTKFSWKFSWTYGSCRTVNILHLHNEKFVDEVLRGVTHRLVTLKSHTVSRGTRKCDLFDSQENNMTSPAPIFTKLTSVWKYYFQTSCTACYSDRKICVENTGRNSFTPLSKVWLELHRFSGNSQLPCLSTWWYFVPVITKIPKETY